MVFRQRKRRVFLYAQIEFLYLLLAGSACVAVGAILQGLENPTNATCVAQIWLTSLGYTLELVPLLVKVAAINRLIQAASRMRRVQLDRSSLRGGVAGISLLVALTLMGWTIFDPPQRQAEYRLTNRVTDDLFAATIIETEYFCESDSEFWDYIAVIWNVVLILCATALAFQSRNVKQDFNESQVLSKLIYSHFLFCLLRVMTFFFPPKVADPMLSIIFSLDTILVVLIYFLPKFLADDTEGVIGGRTGTRISGLNYPSLPQTNEASSSRMFIPSGTEAATTKRNVSFFQAPESAARSSSDPSEGASQSEGDVSYPSSNRALPLQTDKEGQDWNESAGELQELSQRLNQRIKATSRPPQDTESRA